MSQSVGTFDPPDRCGLERNLCAWAVLCALLLFAALAGPFYAGKIYTSDDLWAFHIPLRLFYAQCLAAGDAFDWSPQLFCGFYLSGEGQVGTYHPLHWLLYRTLTFRAALGLELLLSYPLMFAGGCLFLRRLVRDRAAACFGALVFTFSGFNLLHFVHPNAIAVVAHIPWLLWLLDLRLHTEDRRTRAAADAGIALLTASQLLLGYPQYVWFSLLIEGAFVAYTFLDRGAPSPGTPGEGWGEGLCDHSQAPHPNPSPQSTAPSRNAPRSPWRAWWPAVFRLSTAKLLGLMIGAVQLLPTVDVLAASERQTVDAAFVHSGSLHPLNFVQLIGPYLFATRVAGQNTHELGLYFGAVPLMLVVWLLTQRRHWGEHRRWTLFALGVAGVALLLAMGSHGGLYTLQTYLPLVGRFRMPTRYIVLVHLAAALLAALALALLVRRAREQQTTTWRELAPLWRVVAVSIGLAIAASWAWSDRVAAPLLVWCGPLLIFAAAVAVSLAARQVRGGLVLLIVLTALDLGAYGLSYAVYPNTMELTQYLTAGATPPDAQSRTEFIPFERTAVERNEFRSTGQRIGTDLASPSGNAVRAGNHLIVRGLHQVDGYAGLEPARRLDYRQPAALKLAGVRWVLNHQGTTNVPGLTLRDEEWLEAPQPLPRVRLVNRAQASDDPARDLATIDVGSQALVERPLPLVGDALGHAKLIDDRPGRLTIAAHSTGRQLLVVAESFHRGWQATIDGLPAPVLRVNGDFMGCVIEPGRRQVSLEFQPWSLLWGRRLSLVGLALLAAWVVARVARPATLIQNRSQAAISADDPTPPAGEPMEVRKPLSCDTIMIPKNLRRSR